MRQQEKSRELIGLMSRSECTGKRCEETEFVVLDGQLAKAARDLAARSKQEREQEREWELEWEREMKQDLGQHDSAVHHDVAPYAEEMKTLAAKRAKLKRLGRMGQVTFVTLLASALALLGLTIAITVVWLRSRGQSTRITQQLFIPAIVPKVLGSSRCDARGILSALW